MAKPSTTYEFATDSGATTDPGPTRRATGFVAGQRLPAKWLNWALNGFGKWTSYLSNLHDEPEFLSKAYTWTGWHRFHGAFTMKAGIGLSGVPPANEIFYTDDNAGLAPRLRTVMVPLTQFVPARVSFDPVADIDGWSYYEDDTTPDGMGTGWTTGKAIKRLLGHVRLPHGSTLTRVRCWVQTGGMALNVSRVRIDPATGVITRAYLSETTTSANGLLESVAISGADAAADSAIDVFRIVLQSTTDTVHRVRAVELQFLDPGPRNF
jgi:hypothetical protein